MVPMDKGEGMPPHCDSLDGPVVQAAREALANGDVSIVLPFVHAEGEDEVRASFAEVSAVRGTHPEVTALADRLFFETVVRVHRAGEGAAYTGLKPAGLPVGPVLPLAERAIAENNAGPLVAFMTDALAEQLRHRLAHVHELAALRDRSLADARAYTEAMLGFEVYSHHLYKAMIATTKH